MANSLQNTEERVLLGSPKARFYIWSNEHGAWWRDRRRGYTTDIASAGRYTLHDAMQICLGANIACGESPNEMIVPVWQGNEWETL